MNTQPEISSASLERACAMRPCLLKQPSTTDTSMLSGEPRAVSFSTKEEANHMSQFLTLYGDSILSQGARFSFHWATSRLKMTTREA